MLPKTYPFMLGASDHRAMAVACGLRTGARRSSLRPAALATSALISLVGPTQAGPAHAGALPTGASVTSGSGGVQSDGSTLTVNQTSGRLTINWQSFDIGAQQAVNFVQPSASAVAVNRISSPNGSQILGRLNANGQVFLINPNGILFGQGAQINIGGLVASTLDLSGADRAGSLRFSGQGQGSIINQGAITAANGGYVALVGAHVANQGVIVARLGTVALAAGNAVTLTFGGHSLTKVAVDQSTLKTLAENGGLIRADGGMVVMTAGARDAVLASAVNNTGVIEARTVDNRAGVITLRGSMTAGQVNLSGALDASAPEGGDGGSIDTSAAHVVVADSARVSTAAAMGLTGSWLVDPQDYNIAASGGDISGATLSANLAATNITLQSSGGAGAGSGDINVKDAVSWSSNTTLTLTASNNVNVSANIKATGNTAGLLINPNAANGGESPSGTGVFALTPGTSITLSGSAPILSITGQSYVVINSLGAAGSTTNADLQGIAVPDGHYALGSNIDASATSTWNSGAGFTPVNYFIGVFDGLGHTINNLTINQPSGNDIALFGFSEGLIQNVGLVGGSVHGGDNTGALVGRNRAGSTVSNSYSTASVTGLTYTGGLVSSNYGLIDNSYATGNVTGTARSGGLVGLNLGGTISNSHATGNVIGGQNVGGLLGANYGPVNNSYATGSVTGSRYSGGLIGFNNNAVNDTYATGAVNGGTDSYIGGLIGWNMNFGSVHNSYAVGSVSGGASNVGGLVGLNQGSVSTSFWNVTTSGQSASQGGVGLTSAQMQTASNFAGFNFTSTPGAAGNAWVLVDADGTVNNAGGALGAALPMLASEYATSIANRHQLQLIAMAPRANYTLAANIDAAATAGGDVWTGGAGFVPVTGFAGIFDGLNHTIGNLYINRPSAWDDGLFGTTDTPSVIRNVGLVGGSVGGLSVVGALVGSNYGAISNSYATSSVTGSIGVGGLVGRNNGTVSNSYATGAAAGTISVGGLIGQNFGGPVSDSYATGAVTGSSQLGGLVGQNSGTVSNSFWDTTTSGQATSQGGLGLTTAQLQTQANFTSATTANGSVDPGWDFAGSWVMYDGFTAPLLRSFLTPLTIKANDVAKTYDAAAYSGGAGVTYSLSPDSGLLFGSSTVSYGGRAQGAIHANTYAVTPSTGLYSNQQGYLITYASGVLTINPALLTAAANIGGTLAKTYDGTTAATGAVVTGSVTGGLAGDVIALDAGRLTLAYNSSHVAAASAIEASGSLGFDLASSTHGSLASDYTLTQSTLSAVVGAVGRANLIYDATPSSFTTGQSPTGLSGVVNGFVAGETLATATSGTAAWTTVATASSPAGGYAINGAGLTAADYAFSQAPGNATALTLSAPAVIPPVVPPVVAPVVPPVVPPIVAPVVPPIEPVAPASPAPPPPPPPPIDPPAVSIPTAPTPTVLAPQFQAVSNTTAQITASILSPRLPGGPQSGGPSPTMTLASSPSPATGQSSGAGGATVTVTFDIGANGTLRVQNEGVRLPDSLVSSDKKGGAQ